MNISLHVVFSLIFDSFLLYLGLVAAHYTKQIGGGVGKKSLKMITVGFVFLAVAHIIETIAFFLFKEVVKIKGEPLEFVEVSHRLFVFVGLCFIIYGYKKLVKFLNS